MEHSGGRRVGAGAEDGMIVSVGVEDHLLTLLKRHPVQTLRPCSLPATIRSRSHSSPGCR